MKILFHLGHPAHFHLFKLSVLQLIKDGHEVSILIKKKDVLEELLINFGIPYQNLLPAGRKSTFSGIALGQIKQDYRMLIFCLKDRPDLLIGTSVAISHVGKILRIPSINVNEDDAEVVPLYSKLTYPWATTILTPFITSTSKWNYKTVRYNGYHELAYLHPNRFRPDLSIVKKYVNPEETYFIIRFSNLGAHHDKGIRGFNIKLARRLIETLQGSGRIIITSEKEIEPELEPFRMKIKPIDMHHLMSQAKLFIGDSQTMAAEAGVMGVPFIRFNDFVGRIGYLNEMEDRYHLGFGIKPENEERLFDVLISLLKMDNLNIVFKERSQIMLKEKIDVTPFYVWFIENYPESVNVMKENPEYQYNFK